LLASHYLNRLVIRLLSLLMLFAAPANADEVWLVNGDSFSGTVQILQNGVLTFRTLFSDVVKVPWREIAGLATTREVRVTVRNRGWRIARIVPGPEGSLRLLTNIGVSVDTPLNDVVTIVRPQSGIIMTSRAEAGGLVATGASNVSSLHLAGLITWRTLQNQTSVDLNVNGAKTAGFQTARNLASTFRHQEFLTDHIYANGNLILNNDVFRDLDLRVAPGVGIGYQTLRYDVVSFSIDGGGGYVSELHRVEADRSYWAARETIKFEWFVMPRRLQIYHQEDGYFGLTGGENQFVQTRSGVRLIVVGGLLMSAELGLNYDRRPSLGQGSVDRRFAITLGYQLGY